MAALAATGALMVMFAAGGGETETHADPAEVERFLAELEARQGHADAPDATAHKSARDSRADERVRDIVETTAKRAPSPAMLNRLEDVAVSRLAG